MRAAWSALALLSSVAAAQEPDAGRRIVVEPARLELEVGQTARLAARVVDAAGATVEDQELMYFSRARRAVTVDDQGNVEAFAPGEHTLVVRTRGNPEAGEGQEGRQGLGARLSVEVPVLVARPPLAELRLTAPPALYAGTVIELGATTLDVRGEPRAAEVRYASEAPELASFDDFGRLHLARPGRVRVTAAAEGLEAALELELRPNPVESLRVEVELDQARTGDVVHFTVPAHDGAGASIPHLPVEVSVSARLDDEYAPPASGQVARGTRSPEDWRFVAEEPGLYTIVASAGGRSAHASVRVEAREYATKIRLVGRGEVQDKHTSDLWVWEGVDGRDYCVTGTWGADGEALFWDVTDPAAIERVAAVKVDARTVNDVKVSADGTLCVISREGASDRKNGIVLIDVRDPREARVVAEYDEGLTGGVHNVFVDGHHVYALSNGRRYDIIDVSDLAAIRTVGSYELTEPGHSIHDVWVVDGLAYSSNWTYGVHIVDVGNGVKGGSPEHPVYVGSHAYPSGWNHAAFPYTNAETGRSYVVAGDEAFPYGLNVTDRPTYPRGWLHFIDVTDVDNPREVARYQVPEAGTHNFWIEGDTCFVGYYNGGLRVVDVSGELMGDLYRQGREKAFFLPDDPEGYIANTPMVWGPQPHKGRVFFSDWNSGLWCVEVVEEVGE